MSSSLLIALNSQLNGLREDLLELKVEYDRLSRADYTRALGFRVLASAAVEGFVEERCREVAREGAARYHKGIPTRTGPALVVWYLARADRGALPLHLAEHVNPTLIDAAVLAYEKSTNSSHGISARDLRSLVWPLGTRDKDFDPLLFAQLDSWSALRNAAVHIQIKKVKTITTPAGEWKAVDKDLLPLLQELDDGLQDVLMNI